MLERSTPAPIAFHKNATVHLDNLTFEQTLEVTRWLAEYARCRFHVDWSKAPLIRYIVNVRGIPIPDFRNNLRAHFESKQDAMLFKLTWGGSQWESGSAED